MDLLSIYYVCPKILIRFSRIQMYYIFNKAEDDGKKEVKDG